MATVAAVIASTHHPFYYRASTSVGADRPPFADEWVAKIEDPRTPVLIKIATEEGLRGPHLQLFEAIGRVHDQVLGRRLPLNGAGVCGAALADLGLPIELLRGFALLARAAGLLGQLAEERRRPIGMDIYRTVDGNATYVDPTQPET